MKTRSMFQIPMLQSILRATAVFLIKIMGWKVVFDKAELDKLRKAVVVGAPHTSNWDFPLMLLGVLEMGLPVNWIGKHTLFKWPLGAVMRFLGGIPLHRKQSKNFVDAVVEQFELAEEMVLVIAPEGTRKPVERWKSGFYHMAYNAKVPIILAYVDYAKKEMGVMEVVTPSGDAADEILRFQRIYAKVAGKNPENYYYPKPEE